jgi:23S rRNA (adenine2503-C2)-methyltransferase
MAWRATDPPLLTPALHLRSHTPEGLVSLWPDLRLDPGVARRVASRLVFEDRDDLDGVRGLTRTAARALLERGRVTRLRVVDRRRSEVDPFVKYLLRAEDGRLVETVRIPLEQPRWSVCVSSQAGCALACDFCETGRAGLERNLEAWEIVDQVLTVRREGPERPVTGVVFQGQGEPFQNYDNVIRAAQILRHPCGGRIRGDRITISTVGVLPMIERYTGEGHPYRLMLSLTSAFSHKRARLVPLGQRYDVPSLAAAMRRHALSRRAPVSLAWVLMSGVNTEPDEARELARLFTGVRVRVSVIDVNDPTGRYRRAGNDERGRFLSALAANGIGFVRRYSGGPDIHAACGMLASVTRGGVPLADGTEATEHTEGTEKARTAPGTAR